VVYFSGKESLALKLPRTQFMRLAHEHHLESAVEAFSSQSDIAALRKKIELAKTGERQVQVRPAAPVIEDLTEISMLNVFL